MRNTLLDEIFEEFVASILIGSILVALVTVVKATTKTKNRLYNGKGHRHRKDIQARPEEV